MTAVAMINAHPASLAQQPNASATEAGGRTTVERTFAVPYSSLAKGLKLDLKIDALHAAALNVR